MICTDYPQSLWQSLKVVYLPQIGFLIAVKGVDSHAFLTISMDAEMQVSRRNSSMLKLSSQLVIQTTINQQICEVSVSFEGQSSTNKSSAGFQPR